MSGVKTEYAIYKMYRRQDGGPMYWDGPFSSKKAAFGVLKKTYDLVEKGRPVFAVYKVTYERVSPA